MKLTVIIPVYNVEDTIDRCLDSVLGQSFHDMQVIIVDDASTDGSRDKCAAWTGKDHRVQALYHKENQGLSAARNTALAKTRGEYVTFVDSDDTVAPDTYKRLFDILNSHPDYDILEYPVYEKYGNIARQRILYFGKDTEYADMRQYWLKGKAYRHAYACNKVYRRELFRGLTYPVGKKFEDVYILPQLLSRCKLVATTSVGLYHYYLNPRGITQTADGKAMTDLLEAHLHVLPEVHDAIYHSHVLNIALDVYERTGIVHELPRFDYSLTLKQKVLNLIGLKKLCQLNKFLHRFYRRSR